ncbi:MAG: hypothetical protein DMF56_04090 [Acidobacteria bacterium]|nr:MAG: hypothetical protein DMF56_04090 [Acidobacteriota bacterium]
MVRLFRLMLFVMLAAVGVNDDIAVLQALKPPNIAPNVLHSVMEPPPIPDVPPPAPSSEPYVIKEAALISSGASP